MKPFALFLFGLLFLSTLHAQVMGNYAQQQNVYQNINFSAQYRAVPKAATFIGENVIEFNINALSNQKASTYTAIFTVYQLGKTADETNKLLNERLDAVINELKTQGFKTEDIFVDMVNFLPKYEYDRTKKIFSKKTLTEIPKGFELQKNLHIRYRDPALLEKIVTAAARQEIYDIVKVDYFVENPQTVYQELRAIALDYLNNIKQEYQKMGISLDSAYVITAENAWVAYPINRYENYQAFSTQSLDPQDKSSAIIETFDKPTLRFYNAVPANDYDIVINPEILEPTVQFSYNLAVRFTLPERKPREVKETKKEFIMLTPDGEVKTLKLE
ncbi:MAG TPA: SIMPL domain-containing protein [Saprospiraceae bacterium]|nr:SIMPL domain-containing protein [Saprospiraceae bacterium]HMQ83703.1 SIMPL domain-containing protein [Saprospiraceae bacterium]